MNIFVCLFVCLFVFGGQGFVVGVGGTLTSWQMRDGRVGVKRNVR
jgi:hypothetical protein